MADPIIAATILAVTSAGTSVSESKSSAKRYKSIAQAQEDRVKEAEIQASLADQEASEQARAQLVQKRRAQTQTILTSPLGILESPTVGKKTLLGSS